MKSALIPFHKISFLRSFVNSSGRMNKHLIGVKAEPDLSPLPSRLLCFPSVRLENLWPHLITGYTPAYCKSSVAGNMDSLKT